MASQVPGTGLRQVVFGYHVVRGPENFAQNTTQSLFNVTGGRVAVTSLTGEITTVAGTTATTLAIGYSPTVGTAGNSALASATAITSKEVGTQFGLATTVGGALVVGSNASTPLLAGPAAPLTVQAGTITATTNASNTGQWQYSITYVPIDDGASVAAS